MELVDARNAPIKYLVPRGIRTTEAAYELDAIAFATGFDAMTGAMREIDIHTDTGQSIREKWEDGPHTYLGIMMAGFRTYSWSQDHKKPRCETPNDSCD